MVEPKSPALDDVKEAMKEGTVKTGEGIKGALTSAKDALDDNRWVQIGVGLSLVAAIGYLVYVTYNDISCLCCNRAKKEANNSGGGNTDETSPSSADESEDLE